MLKYISLYSVFSIHAFIFGVQQDLLSFFFFRVRIMNQNQTVNVRPGICLFLNIPDFENCFQYFRFIFAFFRSIFYVKIKCQLFSLFVIFPG